MERWYLAPERDLISAGPQTFAAAPTAPARGTRVYRGSACLLYGRWFRALGSAEDRTAPRVTMVRPVGGRLALTRVRADAATHASLAADPSILALGDPSDAQFVSRARALDGSRWPRFLADGSADGADLVAKLRSYYLGLQAAERTADRPGGGGGGVSGLAFPPFRARVSDSFRRAQLGLLRGGAAHRVGAPRDRAWWLDSVYDRFLVSVSDAFDRADSTNLGTDWTEDNGNWSISSNTVQQATVTSAWYKLRWVGAALAGTDVRVQVTGQSVDAFRGFGVMARGAVSTTITGYGMIGFGGDAFYLVEITSSAGETILDTGSACSASTNYTVRLESVGTAHEGFVGGVSDVTASDASYTAAGVGIWSYGGTVASFNNWSAEDLTSGVTGALSATLGAVTSAAAGVVPVVGASTPTLAAVTSAAAGVVAVVGAAAVTLAAVTSAAAGVVGAGPITGAAAVTLADVTSAAAGVVPVVGSSAATLAAVTSAAAGVVPVVGALPVRGRALLFGSGGSGANVDKVKIPIGEPDNVANVGRGDFTIELWLKPAVSQITEGAVSGGAVYDWINGSIFLDRDNQGANGTGGDFGASLTPAGAVAFGVENAVPTARTIIGTTDLRDGAWHHVALTRVRASGDLAIYVDGSREVFFAGGPSGDVHYDDALVPGANVWNPYLGLGGEKHDLAWDGQYAGEIDHVRISTTIRYTGTSYTVPTARFEPDAATVGLWRLDDLDTTARDASGNGIDGTIYRTAAGAPYSVLSDSGVLESVTLGAVTSAAAGVVGSGITGAASVTLAAVTSAAAGVVPVVGSSAVTLADVTSAAAGVVPVVGSSAATLGAVTSAAAGVVGSGLTGAASVTLADVTAAAVGVVPVVGSSAVTLGAVTSAAAGVVPVVGASSATLAAVTSVAGGVVGSGLAGAAAVTLGAVTSAAAGVVPVVGASSATLAAVTSAAAGVVPVVGVLAVTLEDVTQGGTVWALALGGALTADRVTGVATAERLGV